jgi:hypothetical protein
VGVAIDSAHLDVFSKLKRLMTEQQEVPFKHSMSNLECACDSGVQVSKQEPAMVKFMEQSAEAFFKAMVASSHSFEKPVFYIGLYGRPGFNIVADGAIERTPARVFVLPMGLSGFVRERDSASYRIQVSRQWESGNAGRYDSTLPGGVLTSTLPRGVLEGF